MNHRFSILWCNTLALAACLVLLRPDSASAEMYQWTDRDGTVGFADSLEKVPPQYRQSAKRLEETKEPTKSFQRVPTPPDRSGAILSAPTDQGDPYAVWRQRMTAARAELEALKKQRQGVQKEYDTLRAEFYVRSFADPDKDAKLRANLAELDEKIRKKEYEINTAIPDEARRAGVPSGALSQ
jgi:hypothetical protein